jgi:hypothetical protein
MCCCCSTGKAAYNVRGVAVHSLLKLPIGSRGNKDLTGQSLCRLQESVNNIGYMNTPYAWPSYFWLDR